MEKRTKESKKRMNSLILLIAFTAIMLIISTYAWFTSQKDITLSNLRGTVEVAENMEISLDAKTWSQKIDLTDAAKAFQDAQNSRATAKNATGAPINVDTLKAILAKTLDPVSGTGEVGSAVLPLYKGTATSTKLTDINLCSEPTDNGYFAFDIYIKNTSRDGADDILQLNLNSAVQVLPSDPTDPNAITNRILNVSGNEIIRHYLGDAASGLQNTVRVGLALYDKIALSTDTQAEIITKTEESEAVSKIAIWEPNAYDHVEYVTENVTRYNNGAAIAKTDGTWVNDTYAITSGISAAGSKIDNVYEINSAGTSIQKTFKTDNTKDAITKEVTDYKIKSANSLPLNIKGVDEQDFTITSNTVSKLRVYVWLEGQDIDCLNLASQGGGIRVDLGLTKDNEVGTVLATN